MNKIKQSEFRKQSKNAKNLVDVDGMVGCRVVLAACGGSDDPTVTSPPPTFVSATPTAVNASSGVAPTLAQAAPAPAQAAKGDAEKGKTLFVTTCAACHGPAGKGVKGLGKDMTVSKFIAGKSDDEMLAFVKTGRPVGDPLNTTGVMMPPKGGNPALKDEQLQDIIAFIRTINKP